MHRPLVLALALTCLAGGACRDRPTPPQPAADPGIDRLPADASFAIRVDLVRARSWPGFQRAIAALAPIEPALAWARRACRLEVLDEARGLVVARAGDQVTAIVSGLPAERATACAGQPLDIPAIAGAKLTTIEALPGGGLLLASAARPVAAAPAWWATLARGPIAVRAARGERVLTAAVELDEPLRARATLQLEADPAVATTTENMARAVVDYLTRANAATGQVARTGRTLAIELAATAAQLEPLLGAVLPVLVAGEPAPAAEPAPLGPVTCASLSAPVATYLTAAAARSGADKRAELSDAGLRDRLQRAFVASCTDGAWPAIAIECHVINATALARFERCREALGPAQQQAFDRAVVAAMQPARPRASDN